MTDYNDGNWHGWAKREKPPLHDLTRIERVYINSYGVVKNDATSGMTASVGACRWGWGEGLILAFRVTKEHKEPREFWIDELRMVASPISHHGFIKVREVLE